MSMGPVYDAAVIGGGPGGYTAALYCARAGLHTIVLEKLSAGGQMAETEQVENYPGFDKGIDGFTLAVQMQKGAERFGVETVLAEVRRVELGGAVKTLETSEGVYQARCVFAATGAGPKRLDIPREAELTGRGVSYCAACDGMFYRGKCVAVVGGGNTAASDALTLSRICKQVTVIHRRDRLRATKIYHQPLLEAENIAFRWNSTVTGLRGQERLDGIRIKNLKTGAEEFFSCEGLFVSVGRSPETEVFRGSLQTDPNGYLIADETTRTNLPGVFAVGDVRTKAVRQIVTAVADGAAAAHFAEEYLAEMQDSRF